MTGRVLATPEADAAIKQLQSTIDSEFINSINTLNKHGATLSEPNNWDGPKAIQFRTQLWPDVSKALTNAHNQLTELRGQLDQIQTAIRQAGGGS